jgi:hypothetical protein
MAPSYFNVRHGLQALKRFAPYRVFDLERIRSRTDGLQSTAAALKTNLHMEQGGSMANKDRDEREGKSGGGRSGSGGKSGGKKGGDSGKKGGQGGGGRSGSGGGNR